MVGPWASKMASWPGFENFLINWIGGSARRLRLVFYNLTLGCVKPTYRCAKSIQNHVYPSPQSIDLIANVSPGETFKNKIMGWRGAYMILNTFCTLTHPNITHFLLIHFGGASLRIVDFSQQVGPGSIKGGVFLCFKTILALPLPKNKISITK